MSRQKKQADKAAKREKALISETDYNFIKVLAEYGVMDVADIPYVYETSSYYRMRIKALKENGIIAVKNVEDQYGATYERNIQGMKRSKVFNSQPDFMEYIKLNETIIEASKELKRILPQLIADNSDVIKKVKKYDKFLSAQLTHLENEYRCRPRLRVVKLTYKGRRLAKEMFGIEERTTEFSNYDRCKRQMLITGIAVRLQQLGVIILQCEYEKLLDRPDWQYIPVFVQSNVLKKKNDGIDYQNRVHGVLYCPGGVYAIYNLEESYNAIDFNKENSLVRINLHEAAARVTGTYMNPRPVTGAIMLLSSIEAARAFEEMFYPDKENGEKNTRAAYRKYKMNSISVLVNNFKAYLVIERMMQPNWKEEEMKRIFRTMRLKKSSWGAADFETENGEYIIVLNNNDIRAKMAAIESYNVMTKKPKVMVYANESRELMGKRIPKEWRIL